VDGLQERAAVQGQVKVAAHPGGEGSLPPLALCYVDPPDQSVRDLRTTTTTTVPGAFFLLLFTGKLEANQLTMQRCERRNKKSNIKSKKVHSLEYLFQGNY